MKTITIIFLATMFFLPSLAGAADASIKLPSVNGADGFVVQDKYGTPLLRIASDGTATVLKGIAPNFDSGWIADNNLSSHKTMFAHNFGVFPSKVSVWFATTNNPTTVYPLIWPFTLSVQTANPAGPVTIEMNRSNIFFNISSGQTLYGVWSATTTSWTSYTTGFWRVKAWR